jgi:hypothetical protein
MDWGKKSADFSVKMIRQISLVIILVFINLSLKRVQNDQKPLGAEGMDVAHNESVSEPLMHADDIAIC